MKNEMKTLLLVRHGHAGNGIAGQPDKARALSPRGQREATRVGLRLAAEGFSPDLIVASPAVRTCETARAIAREVGYSLEDIVPSERLYEAEVDDLLEAIEGLNDRHARVLVVAHNPGLSELAWRFNDEMASMVPGAVARFVFETDKWAEVPRATIGQTRLDSP